MDTGAVIRGRPSDGRPPFLYFGWAGTVGRPGMSHSVAVGANSLPAPGWRAAVDGAGFVVFADVVARFAAEHDVVYRPKIGRSHDGKQLYAFGKATMYMDRSVTFVKKPDTGLFKPVPLEELLALAS